nr:MAG TPA: hypothetical protein [Caudoviricetes sp.]
MLNCNYVPLVIRVKFIELYGKISCQLVIHVSVPPFKSLAM